MKFFISIVRKMHLFLSDAPFLRALARWMRNMVLGKRAWYWKIRDLVADAVPLQSFLGKDVEIHITGEGTFVKAVDGIEYDFDYYPAISIPAHLLVGNFAYDRPRFDYVVERLPRNATVVSAGAGMGEYAMSLAKLGANVHAFEPMNSSFRRLVKNVKRNHLDVACNKIALWDESGEFGLTAVDVENNNLVPLSSNHVSEIVTAMRLDEYFIERGVAKVDLIIADIQGAEFQMVKGLGKFMDSRPALLLEIVPSCTANLGYDYSELFEYLIERGYIYVGVRGDGMVSTGHYTKQISEAYIFYFAV